VQTFLLRSSRVCCFTAAVAGCTANHPLPVSPEPETVTACLSAHPHAHLQVTNHRGSVRWPYAAEVQGDSLIGYLTREPPRERAAMALVEVHARSRPHFSTGGTAGLVGGVPGAAAIGTLVTIGTGPEPVN